MMKIMIFPNARGGIRSVAESYCRDGLIESENFRTITSYEEGGFIFRQFVFIKAIFYFITYVLRFKVELTHLHSAMRGSFWRKFIVAQISRFFHIPVILHLHGSEMTEFYASGNTLAKRLIQFQLEHVSEVFVLSESWRAFIKGIAPRANVSIIPNYIEIPEINSNKISDIINVTFAGYVGDRKGAFDLIKAFETVRKVNSRIKLSIYGNGEIEKARNLVQELGLESCVKIKGWIASNELREVLKKTDLFILPSYNEGLPMSVLEAMSFGLPVITTPVGGIPELITHRVNGLLVAPGDLEGIAGAVIEIFQDSNLRDNIAKRAYVTVKSRHSRDIVIPRIKEAYARNITK